MSNLESRPGETVCTPSGVPARATRLLPAREVPLGGVRGISVQRALPHRETPTVGAWCFLDQFGPSTAPMQVLPHPHTGLQTVTWPFAGRIRHRDSLGSDLAVRPGELNLMTSGHGVSHSEFAIEGGAGADQPLHGLQLWVALPDAVRGGPATFEHHADLPVHENGTLSATVFAGTLEGQASAATTHTPLVGADIGLRSGRAGLALEPAFEHAVLVVEGSVQVDGRALESGPLLYLPPGREGVELETSADARLVLLGGAPFEEELVMWWNFVGRSHAEIEQARQDWEGVTRRFGAVDGHDGLVIPAPPLPNARLTPRRRAR